MDSDAKELGHVRVARSKDRFGLPGLECDHAFLRWQQCSQSKIAHDSLRVRDTSTPTWCDRPVEGPACRPTLIPCCGVAPGVASTKHKNSQSNQRWDARWRAARVPLHPNVSRRSARPSIGGE